MIKSKMLHYLSSAPIFILFLPLPMSWRRTEKYNKYFMLYVIESYLSSS